jgi:hypothetical protein
LELLQKLIPPVNIKGIHLENEAICGILVAVIIVKKTFDLLSEPQD